MLGIKSDKVLPLIFDGLIIGMAHYFALYLTYRIFEYIC